MTDSPANPFEPPSSPVGVAPEPSSEAESIRLAHLGREKGIKTLGGFFFFLASIMAAISLAIAVDMARTAQSRPDLRTTFLAIGGGMLVGGGLIAWASATIGRGLRRFMGRGRWLAILVVGLLLLAGLAGLAMVVVFYLGKSRMATIGADVILVGLAIVAAVAPGLALVPLVRKGTAELFSPEYRAVVEATPTIRARSSLAAKACYAGFFLSVAAVVIYNAFKRSI